MRSYIIDTIDSEGELDCKVGNTNTFMLNLTMDDFPQDISWDLKEMSGDLIFGESFLASSYKKVGKKICVNQDQLVLFTIEDKYSYGLCCEWGNGSFEVQWNEKSVLKMNTSDFKTNKSLCLPTESNTQYLFVEIELDDRPKETWWSLYNDTYNLIHHSSSYIIQNETVKRGLCIYPYNCLIFVIGDDGWNGIEKNSSANEYSLTSQDGISEKRTGKFSSHDVYRHGNCKTCLGGEKLVKLIINADNMPEKIL